MATPRDWQPLLVWKLSGGSYEVDHAGVELDDLGALVHLRAALVESAKAIWRTRNERLRVPHGVEAQVELRVRAFEEGCVQGVVLLGVPRAEKPPLLFPDLAPRLTTTERDQQTFFDAFHDAAHALQAVVAGSAHEDVSLLPVEGLSALARMADAVQSGVGVSIVALRKAAQATPLPPDAELPQLGSRPPSQWRQDDDSPREVILRDAARVSYGPTPVRPGVSEGPPLPPTNEATPVVLLAGEARDRLGALVAQARERNQPPQLRSERVTLSGEVWMVSRDGRALIRADNTTDDVLLLFTAPEQEKELTRALDEHATMRVRARGEMFYDGRGRPREFVAQKIRAVAAPPLNAPSEALFEQLAVSDPARLLELLRPDRLAPGLLTYAAEIAGRSLPTEIVEAPLALLLTHPEAVVREGALLGLGHHDVLREDTVAIVKELAEEDPNPGVRVSSPSAG